MQLLVGAEDSREEAVRAMRIEMVVPAALGIPPPLIAEKNDAIAVVEEHLRGAARIQAGILGVLE